MTPHAAKRKVLVVDDDPNIVAVITALLAREEYEVVHADYSLPALFRTARHQPDLIITDLGMPVMDGFDLLRQLKGHAESRDIPVVVITASGDEESRKAAFAAGCTAFITKPFDANSLREQIQRCFKP